MSQVNGPVPFVGGKRGWNSTWASLSGVANGCAVVVVVLAVVVVVVVCVVDTTVAASVVVAGVLVVLETSTTFGSSFLTVTS